ncbi:bifunctional demethylmenaquinone methyltransferase/2-methoxy-6-polyprenyl-1,4-benzoquinol methylase UbiE [Thermococcus sp. 21S9]|uniref:bifunctional demethylmenaquinone methyltransferase/2-methoxy-6-polyprenyl-1,4-benzoquinol methylase UbiE n=1 Tax=Thermococcus sp. 21S9 TaxID=1638223 RepID=UPI00143AEE86|nr:bifunctional demethylmenaquinone methyltransferase/2-methoxy-6-polyprenyl-1,4-benzoquinol methylase UbiE [Thermococcus sp. 21S9]NJE55444.1 bifunctional demethylmenaquinone methyltransferase/2-methoxy-6-polyprenyl-1,4-benzoquinol methylase UbiE [Thermococcus sp. 21S9]
MVKELFDSIAERYDLTNRLISLGLDRLWRRKACEEVLKSLKVRERPLKILDVACGTGDMMLCMRKRLEKRNLSGEFYGLDCSEEMLRIARRKVPFARLSVGTAEEMPYPDGSFDIVSVAFGLRNFSDREKAIKELHRVLKPGGRLVILEFSKNPSLLGKMAWLYTRTVVPIIGKLTTGNEKAYEHLVSSIDAFSSPEELRGEFEKRGFRAKRLRWLFPRIAFILVLERL